MNPTIAVTGVKETISMMKKIQHSHSQDVEKDLNNAAAVINKKALYYCPIEYGPLRKSVKIEIKSRGFGMTIDISFGGPDAPYALYVHEDLTKYHAPPTTAKFLEMAVKESKPEIEAIMKRKSVSAFSKVINGERA